ncbi:MAG: hypothetical protein RL754_1328 [Bacteroidota bacterium]|jgi:UDP-3-O-[3-hydroxymyristoyl] glucosamine N-acyltransferase
MRFNPTPLNQLFGAIGLHCPPNLASFVVKGIAPLDEAKEDEISFLTNPKYVEQAQTSSAGIILVDPKTVLENDSAQTVVVDNPYLELAKLLNAVESMYFAAKDEREMATISPEAQIGEGTIISAGVIIEQEAIIGRHCYIGPGAKVLRGCVLGDHVRLEAGAVIGADGFGYAPDGSGQYHRIPQLGNVVIEDRVSIGANTTIDRATLGSTRICQGTKIDNQCQIAHNVEIGSNTVLAAQVGVAGSTIIGKNCMIGGQVGIVGHLKIGDNVNILAQSGVMNDVTSNKTIFGSPALDKRNFLRSFAAFKKQGE